MNRKPERTSRIRAESLRIRFEVEQWRNWKRHLGFPQGFPWFQALLGHVWGDTGRGEGRGGEGRGEMRGVTCSIFVFSFRFQKQKIKI